MRQQVYRGEGGKLIYSAFGVDTVFHSKQAAEKHAADSGAEPLYTGDHEHVAQQTRSEADPAAYGLTGEALPDPNEPQTKRSKSYAPTSAG